MIKRSIGDITIQRDGDGLAIQWALVGPAGTYSFAATPAGTLVLTGAGLTQAGVPAEQRDALISGVWDFTPMEVRELSLDGAVVRTR